ncbi:T9SS type A sorting domain-containing protein [uncultured Psychroserpens sp.]|uniref:T9SS type A sorting domain-containing protein n=1 Tax=uncultured Psychroserpens sp. TaxID=255436 RepID=UPI002616C8DE|nr:T9SS type A sorting domain-containing protein [uncultured Psychroserpens sp.]
MKTKLLFLSLFLISAIALSQVVAGQVDDFEDGTTQSWAIGSPSQAVSPPANVASGGPAGVDDNYLTYTSQPSASGAGSKMIIFSAGASQWANSSNYTAQGIVAIKMDVRASDEDLQVRVAFQGPNGKRFCTTNAVEVRAGTGWNSVTIPISTSDFTSVSGGPTTIDQVLANVNTMRIMSAQSPTWANPDVFTATIDLDNITASTTLDVNDLEVEDSFEISPNPATSKLNIKLVNSLNNANIVVYNVLGKKVYSKTLSAMTSSIDVSQWNSGVYLVRLSTDNQTITKRFVKQ